LYPIKLCSWEEFYTHTRVENYIFKLSGAVKVFPKAVTVSFQMQRHKKGSPENGNFCPIEVKVRQKGETAQIL
jgi:hypothetical protein